MLHRVVWEKLTDVSEVLPASIIVALMMEAVSTSATSLNLFQAALRDIPEDSHFLTVLLQNICSYVAQTCAT
jgi:hypothetical protein